jgi:SET domain-containing protein
MTPHKLVKKESPIHGYGLFAKQSIPRGELVINWLNDPMIELVREPEHLERIKNNPLVNQTGIRLVGDIFLHGWLLADTDYVNHSDDPNLIYSQGLCFSKRNIAYGEELSVDYRFLNSIEQTDVVRGYSATEALRRSGLELQELFLELWIERKFPKVTSATSG